MCNISFCEVDSKVDQFFQPALYITVIVLGLPTNCMALWAAYMQVRHAHIHTHSPVKLNRGQNLLLCSQMLIFYL